MEWEGRKELRGGLEGKERGGKGEGRGKRGRERGEGVKMKGVVNRSTVVRGQMLPGAGARAPLNTLNT